jgi:hypothetical protein
VETAVLDKLRRHRAFLDNIQWENGDGGVFITGSLTGDYGRRRDADSAEAEDGGEID